MMKGVVCQNDEKGNESIQEMRREAKSRSRMRLVSRRREVGGAVRQINDEVI
jgi:hypothetical protein